MSPGSSLQTRAGIASSSPSGGGRMLSYRFWWPQQQQDIVQVAYFHNTPPFVLWYNITNILIKTHSDSNAVLLNPQHLAFREPKAAGLNFLPQVFHTQMHTHLLQVGLHRAIQTAQALLPWEDTSNSNTAQLPTDQRSPAPCESCVLLLLGVVEITPSHIWFLHASLWKQEDNDYVSKTSEFGKARAKHGYDHFIIHLFILCSC